MHLLIKAGLFFALSHLCITEETRIDSATPLCHSLSADDLLLYPSTIVPA